MKAQGEHWLCRRTIRPLGERERDRETEEKKQGRNMSGDMG